MSVAHFLENSNSSLSLNSAIHFSSTSSFLFDICRTYRYPNLSTLCVTWRLSSKLICSTSSVWYWRCRYHAVLLFGIILIWRIVVHDICERVIPWLSNARSKNKVECGANKVNDWRYQEHDLSCEIKKWNTDMSIDIERLRRRFDQFSPAIALSLAGYFRKISWKYLRVLIANRWKKLSILLTFPSIKCPAVIGANKPAKLLNRNHHKLAQMRTSCKKTISHFAEQLLIAIRIPAKRGEISKWLIWENMTIVRRWKTSCDVNSCSLWIHCRCRH